MKRQISHMKRQQPLRRVRVAILLPQRVWPGSIYLARDLLQVAGTLAARSHDVAASAIFSTRFLGLDTRGVVGFGGIPVRPDATLDRRRYDVVIVPPQFAATADASDEDVEFASWLVRQQRGGAFVLGLGSAVLLAKAGLLDGLRATGFVAERALFTHSFPRVRYSPSQRLVAEDRIVTICGIGPIVDGCAHLIDHFFGAHLARRFLRHASTDALPADEHLALWASHLKRHGDRQVLAAQEVLERELQRVPALSRIAAQVALGERTLSRRFAAATGLTVRDYVAALRLELADFLLRTSHLPLVHVARECGYGSASALSRAVAARHGSGPAAYRSRSQSVRT